MIEQNGSVLRVTGGMLISDARALLESGREFLRSASGAMILDLSAAEETDSSALAVVFGLLRTASERGVTMQVTNPPSSMISQAALYGVSDSLPLA